MFPQYVISGEVSKRAHHFVSPIGEDAAEFYPYHARR